MRHREQLTLNNGYARLPEIFWSTHIPVSLKDGFLIHFNIQAATCKAQDEADFSEIDRLKSLLKNPYDAHHELEKYAAPPPIGRRGSR